MADTDRDVEEEKGLFEHEDGVLTGTDDDEPSGKTSSTLLQRMKKSEKARTLLSYRDKFVRLFPKKCREKFDSFWIIAIAMIAFVVVVAISLIIAIQFTVKDKGAVATDNSDCTKLAERILQRRGSAVDAAITAMLCLGLYQPESSGIGGGGFMIVRDPDGSVTAIDFREVAPYGATRDMFKGDSNLIRSGGLAVAVPMELCGITEAFNRFHKLEWSALVDPVIDKACNGFVVSPHLARALHYIKDEPLIANSTVFNNTFYKEGQIAKAGDVLSNRRLGDTLLNFRTQKDPNAFYSGTTANQTISLISEYGGVMTMKDFENVCKEVKVYTGDDVLKMEFNNHTAYTPPVPSSGPVLLSILNILSGYQLSNGDLTNDGYARGVDYQRLVEAFKFAFGARDHLGDPDVCSVENCNTTIAALQDRLLSEAFGREIRSKINDTHTHMNQSYYGDVYRDVNDMGTTHITVLAPNGQAVSVISTVNYYFGSLLMTEGGFFLNNEMADFSIDGINPDVPLNPNNYIEPRKRPLSSQSPIIVVKDEKSKFPSLVTGAAGGKHIITGTAQCVINKLRLGLSLNSAVSHRRLHHQLYPNILEIEDEFPTNLVTYLENAGHSVKHCNATSCPISVVQAIAYDSASSTIFAQSDPRKDANGGSVVEVLEQ